MKKSCSVHRGSHAFGLALGMLLCSHLLAQEPQIRASLEDDGAVWVGQRVNLVVELLAPGYFDSAASFDMPDPAGVLLMPPAGHPVVSSETIDGQHYTVQRHEFSAWPMRAGEQAIPAVTARFRYKRAPLDKDSEQASLTTSSIAFSVQLPPGAGSLGNVISARDLELKESWEPLPGSDDIPAGTAFRRTVTFSAPDVPGMVFPPFPAGDIGGLGIYKKSRVNDRSNRGSLSGERQDEITYICQRPGQYTIPAARLTWYDLDAGRLRTAELPARTLNVVANPDMASADPAATTSSSRVSYGLVLTAALALGFIVFLAAQNARVRRLVERLVAPLRPVHLEPLNPAPATGRETKH